MNKINKIKQNIRTAEKSYRLCVPSARNPVRAYVACPVNINMCMGGNPANSEETGLHDILLYSWERRARENDINKVTSYAGRRRYLLLMWHFW